MPEEAGSNPTRGELAVTPNLFNKSGYISIMEFTRVYSCVVTSDSLYSENELHTFSSPSLVQCSSLSAFMVIYWFDFELRTEL